MPLGGSPARAPVLERRDPVVIAQDRQRCADLIGGPQTRPVLDEHIGPGEAITELAKNLPPGFEFQWTELVYQKIIAGNTAMYVYPLCILLVFMESFLLMAI